MNLTTLQLIFVAVSYSIVCWYGVCVLRTYKQRQALMPGTWHPQFWTLLDYYRQVPYLLHLWFLFTFRSPLQLYPQELLIAKGLI